MKMRRLIVLIVIITIFLLAGILLFYLKNKNSSSTETIQKPILYIGWIGPLSGSVKILGVDNFNSVQLAFEQYAKRKNENDPEIRLVAADDQYQVRQSIREYDKMVSKYKPIAIFLSTYSSVEFLYQKALKDNIILIDPIDNDLNLASLNKPWHPNAFMIAKETEGLAAIIANILVKQNKKNIIAIYYNGDDFMPTLADTLNKILKSSGKELKLFGYNDAHHDNFNNFIRWGKNHQADAYVFFGYVELRLVMKKIRDMNITAPFYSVNVVSSPSFRKDTKKTLNKIFIAHFTKLDGNQALANEFMKLYQQRYHQYPDAEWVALQSYDASNILIYAIHEALSKPTVGKNNLAEAIRQSLIRISDYPGTAGTISIKPSGASDGIYPSLYILENDKVIPYSQQ